jgi:hypothetical protein
LYQLVVKSGGVGKLKYTAGCKTLDISTGGASGTQALAAI